MKGAFGGYGSFVQTKSNVWDYKIPTDTEGKSAENLKLIIYSRKYRTEIFDFPILEGKKKSIEIKPEFLKTVPFSGRVLLSNQLNAENLRLQISYTPDWECVFFQLMDCLLGFSHIAFVNLEKDGTFKVDLPSFADDKVISSFGEMGKFSFDMQNKQTGKSLFRLKPKNTPKGFNTIQTALNYSNENVFIPEFEK
jgi:hypothetical protein